jgi:hypothetical protein
MKKDNAPQENQQDFDFFHKKTVKHEAPIIEEYVIKKVNYKFQRQLIAAFTGIAGLVGMHFKIDGAGWLIFLAFLMIDS